MVPVVLIYCPDYTYSRVKIAIERGLGLLGGPHSFADSGEKILLKPNLVTADPPEKCVTTHPAVFRAVAEVFLDAGVRVNYGDSPAIGNVKAAVRKAGLAEAAEQLGLELADFKSGETVYFEAGRQNRRFVIARGVREADGLISLPKLKTHGLERLTGSIKNQFGCVPGTSGPPRLILITTITSRRPTPVLPMIAATGTEQTLKQFTLTTHPVVVSALVKIHLDEGMRVAQRSTHVERNTITILVRLNACVTTTVLTVMRRVQRLIAATVRVGSPRIRCNPGRWATI